MARFDYLDDADSRFRPNRGSEGAAHMKLIGTVTPTNKSGSVTVGGVAQVVIAANPDRRGYWIQNLSAADMWINTEGTASPAASSMKLKPGVMYETPASASPTGALSVYGATTGQQFSAREW